MARLICPSRRPDRPDEIESSTDAHTAMSTSQMVSISPSTSDSMADEIEGIWSPDIEQSFLEALAIYPPCGRRKIIVTDERKMYGRNELVARYIKIRTGKIRTRKQVSSHLQVLTKRRSKELQSLRQDKNAQRIIWNRLKQSTSIEMECTMAGETQAVSILNQNELEISSVSVSKSAPGLTSVKNLLLEDSISYDQPFTTGVDELILSSVDAYSAVEIQPTGSTPPSQPLMPLEISSTPSNFQGHKFSVSNFLPASPTVYSNGTDQSRCSSNSSVSSYSLGSINTRVHNPLVRTVPLIGDERFRLVDLSAFVELKRTSQSSFFYPYAEICSIHQQDLVRLHANDIQMKNIQAFETISIDQISDKFPVQDGFKDLYEHHPHGSFFLIKFWTDVSCSSASFGTPTVNRDESFFSSYTFTSCSYQPIQISTRLCSFGKQILEKVEISEHPQQDHLDQFIYRFDRSPLCDYMVQFIQKLRSLPNTTMMNSVLENFTVLQVIKCRDETQRLLLCLAFVFEIAVLDAAVPQYQVYKLVAG